MIFASITIFQIHLFCLIWFLNSKNHNIPTYHRISQRCWSRSLFGPFQWKSYFFRQMCPQYWRWLHWCRGSLCATDIFPSPAFNLFYQAPCGTVPAVFVSSVLPTFCTKEFFKFYHLCVLYAVGHHELFHVLSCAFYFISVSFWTLIPGAVSVLTPSFSCRMLPACSDLRTHLRGFSSQFLWNTSNKSPLTPFS